MYAPSPVRAKIIEFGFAGSVTAAPTVPVAVSIGNSDVLLVLRAITCVAVVPFTFAITGLLNTEPSPVLQLGAEQATTIVLDPAPGVATFPAWSTVTMPLFEDEKFSFV